MYSANGGPKTMQLQLRRSRFSNTGTSTGPGHREPARKPNKVWLVVVMMLLVAAMALQSLAVAMPSWVTIGCRQGAVTVGLWLTCGRPLVNISVPKRAQEPSVSYLNASLKVESMKRSVEITGTNGDSSEQQKPAPFLLWDNCISVVSDVDNSYPVWFEATQLLETMGLGCTAITTLLLTLYACAPTFMALQVALGFAAASFTSGGFIIVGMFNVSGGKRAVTTVLPPSVICDAESSNLHVSFKLSSVAVSLLGVAGVVATLASILEKGDAPQNRIRKEEEAAPAITEADTGADSIAITPPASPTPPSTISDNESTPLSFDSIYESSDCPPYPSDQNHKNMVSSKKKVSFQNRRGYSHAPQPVLENSISANVPVCNIPISHSAPYGLHQPQPRRLSALSDSIGSHHTGSLRRESSPLGYIHQGVPLGFYQGKHPPITSRRQDSMSSQGSINHGGRKMSQEDKGYTQMTSSRNSVSSSGHYPRDSHSHSRRSSRT